MSRLKNLVLGCGPAALLAAHALDQAGEPFSIVSRKQKSKLGGAQFLGIAIPGLNDAMQPDAVVTYLLNGDSDGYRTKLYGINPDVGAVSMDDFTHNQNVEAWNLQRTYDRLWMQYEERIFAVSRVTPENMAEWIREFENIFSSIPAPALCRETDRHWFRSHVVRIWPWTKTESGLAEGLVDNTIIYNGDVDSAWCRASMLWGVGSTEYPAHAKLPPIPLVTAHKPLATNCDCWPTVTRLGRHAEYKKGVQIHQAWIETIKVIGAVV